MARITLVVVLLLGPGLGRALAAPPAQRLGQVLRTARDYKQRLAAAIGLGRLGDRQAVPGLIEALRDPHPTVRGTVAGVLGKLGDQRARSALEELIGREKDAYVLGQAQTVLAGLLRGADRPAAAGEMQVDGLLGSIEEDQAEQGVEARMPQARVCYNRERATAPFLAGNMELRFRIDRQGKVRWVRAGRSDLGSVAAERCILREMAQARFVAPSGGGEAEFKVPVSFGPDQPPPPSTPLPEAVKLQKSCKKLLRKLVAPRGLQVTVYVDSEGEVVSAGLAADEEIPEPFAEELVKRLRASKLGPRFGGATVKITSVLACSRR